MEAITMTAILTSIGEVFTQVLTWFGDVLAMVVEEPLLVLFVIAIPLCSYCVTRVKMLMSL